MAVIHQRDAVFITEGEGKNGAGRKILFVNPAFTEMTGFTVEDAIGATPGITVGERTDPQAIRRIMEAVKRKLPVRQEILKYRKDGSTLWVELELTPVVSDGEGYIVAVMRDVSERKEQSERLRLQAVALEQASATKSQFLANMSHELRTPLNAIIGYTDLLLKRVYGPLAPPQERTLGRVAANSRHLLDVVSTILDITRIEAGRVPVRVSAFSLRDLIGDVLGELGALFSKSRVPLRSTFRPGAVRIVSDKLKVKQILVNLLSNAVKFTLEGVVHVTVTPEKDRIAIAVTDTGVGIAPEHHAKVFEDFWQADGSPSRSFGGTGLGLSISRRMAEMLEGELRLESEVGKGSTFTLILPRALDRGTRVKPRAAARREPKRRAARVRGK